jgi:cellulose synthase/poly-beta-1,6-N-acetylglucosamine synthase-like glycosyltransferase
VQAEYLLVAPAESSPKTRISAFAFLVRNKIRASGLSRMGLPCQLTGSGMAFAWEVIELAEATHDNVVEDLAMGIDLALKGHPPLFCAWAHVRSVLPSSESAAKTQRRRWEGGHLQMIRAHLPRLLVRAATTPSANCLSLALDLMVPPLAFLVVTATSAAGAAWVLTAFGIGAGPALLLTAELGLIAAAVGAAWARHGREVLPLRQALQIPLYVAWKIPNYVAILTRRTREGWVRTERNPRP